MAARRPVLQEPALPDSREGDDGDCVGRTPSRILQAGTYAAQQPSVFSRIDLDSTDPRPPRRWCRALLDLNPNTGTTSTQEPQPGDAGILAHREIDRDRSPDAHARAARNHTHARPAPSPGPTPGSKSGCRPNREEAAPASRRCSPTAVKAIVAGPSLSSGRSRWNIEDKPDALPTNTLPTSSCMEIVAATLIPNSSVSA